MSSELLGTATDANFESEVLKSDKPVLVDILGSLVRSL